MRVQDSSIKWHNLDIVCSKNCICLINDCPVFLCFVFVIQGDGPKLVRELFRVAEEHAPSIVFIDEIDAIGTKRYDKIYVFKYTCGR